MLETKQKAQELYAFMIQKLHHHFIEKGSDVSADLAVKIVSAIAPTLFESEVVKEKTNVKEVEML